VKSGNRGGAYGDEKRDGAVVVFTIAVRCLHDGRQGGRPIFFLRPDVRCEALPNNFSTSTYIGASTAPATDVCKTHSFRRSALSLRLC
jgi:hypothetical protein